MLCSKASSLLPLLFRTTLLLSVKNMYSALSAHRGFRWLGISGGVLELKEEEEKKIATAVLLQTGGVSPASARADIEVWEMVKCFVTC